MVERTPADAIQRANTAPVDKRPPRGWRSSLSTLSTGAMACAGSSICACCVSQDIKSGRCSVLISASGNMKNGNSEKSIWQASAAA